jgi:NADP-dependent 3-hydroxy acid dehydrogenase YdfG
MDMETLQGRVVVITSGTSGIGARTAEAFVDEGARVIVGARREEVGERFTAQLGPRASFVRTDVTVEADVAALINHTVKRFGQLDCLVNNAGTLEASGPVGTLDLDRFRHVMAVHVGGVAAGMKHAAQVMCAQGSGSIINIASIAGHIAG